MIRYADGVRAVLLVVSVSVLGCGEQPRPAPPVPIANATARGCPQAAAGIERGTRSVREPDETVLGPMQARCSVDTWSSTAIDCFSTMTEDDLGRCAGLLEPKAREAMLGALGGGAPGRTSIAVAVARLANLKVGVVECDRFVTVVTAVLGCEQLPVEMRAQLGIETADFWSLPTDRLSLDARGRMAAVCGRSLGELQQKADDAGCKP